jgi:hypothetical protein
MATELNYDKLVKDLKKDPDLTQSQAADNQGLTIGQVSMMKFCQAQVEAGIWDEIPATTKAVKAARNEGNRWELIAARADVSRAKVIDLFGGQDAAKDSYVGKGRNFQNGDGEKPAPKRGRGRATAEKEDKPKGRQRQVTRSSGRPSSRRSNPS